MGNMYGVALARALNYCLLIRTFDTSTKIKFVTTDCRKIAEVFAVSVFRASI